MAWKKIESEEFNSRAWDFEKEGDLDGVYLKTRAAKTKKGKPITFHEFKVKEETISLLGGTVLDRQFAEIAENTRVLIQYLGEKESKTGTTYKNYSISLWE